MLKIFILSGLFFLSFISNNVFADECTEWTFKEGNREIFQINTCANPSGKSGYYELNNLTSYQVKACWKIEFNNGKSNSGCRTINGYEKGGRGSCYSCNPISSGVSGVTLTKFDKK